MADITPIARQSHFIVWNDDDGSTAAVLILNDDPNVKGTMRLSIADRAGVMDLPLSKMDAQRFMEALQERLR